MDATELPEVLIQNPAYMLWLTSNAWIRWVKRALSPLDITHVQYGVLSAVERLSNTSGSVSQVQVSRFASMDENMVSQVIRHLNQRGLLERVRDVDDRRAQRLSLTETGSALCYEARIEVFRAAEEFFAIIPMPQQTELVKTLQQLLVHEHNHSVSH